MEVNVDIQILQNGIWTFLRVETFPFFPLVGHKVELFIDEELKIYEVKEVVIKPKGSNSIVKIG
jgi:hypothetical protein